MANVSVQKVVTSLFDLAASRSGNAFVKGVITSVKALVIGKGLPALQAYLAKKQIDLTDAKSVIDSVFTFAMSKADGVFQKFAIEEVKKLILSSGLDTIKTYLDSKGINILEMKLPPAVLEMHAPKARKPKNVKPA